MALRSLWATRSRHHHPDSNQELLTEILKILAIFAGGFGTGFGAKAYIDKKK
jgi:hypothetical protein